MSEEGGAIRPVADPDKPWTFLSSNKVQTRLAEEHGEDKTAIEQVVVSLSRILVNPYNPPGLTSYPFRTKKDERRYPGQRYIAELPHDWYITYVPIKLLEMPPVLLRNNVVVEAFNRMPNF